jgi:hypothetical protein
MKARPTPHGRAAQDERAARWTRALDALHRHCQNARSLAALLKLCGEVDPGAIDAEAVGHAGHWIVEELDALHGCVRGLEEAAR